MKKLEFLCPGMKEVVYSSLESLCSHYSQLVSTLTGLER